MNEQDIIKLHDQYADSYDQSVRDYGSYLAEILFGLTFDFVNREERLLDLGIGTGLSSVPFAKAGLEIAGADGSQAMLAICREKGFAGRLDQVDLTKTPWPYPDGSFEHVLACGLFHFFDDIEPSFSEVARLLTPGGTYTFSVINQPSGEAKQREDRNITEFYRGGMTGFAHSDAYVESLLQRNNMTILKRARILLWSGVDDLDDLFYGYVSQEMA